MSGLQIKHKSKNNLNNNLGIYIVLFSLLQITPLVAQDMAQLAMRARINLYEKWNFDSVEYYFDLIINEKYTPAFAYMDYGWFLVLKDRNKEGLREIRKAAQMDPDDAQLSTWYSWALLWYGDVEEADKWISKALKLDPENGEALHLASRIAVARKDYKEAIRLAEVTASKSPLWRGILPWTYAQAGQVEKAIEWAEKYSAENKPDDNWLLMETYSSLEMDDRALEYLQGAFDHRYPFMPWLELTPGLESLHSHPLFQEILVQLNLPDN